MPPRGRSARILLHSGKIFYLPSCINIRCQEFLPQQNKTGQEPIYPTISTLLMKLRHKKSLLLYKRICKPFVGFVIYVLCMPQIIIKLKMHISCRYFSLKASQIANQVRYVASMLYKLLKVSKSRKQFMASSILLKK